MGTNYYLKGRPAGAEVEGLHIGKSSAGWCFALHVYPDGVVNAVDEPVFGAINDLSDWIPLFVRHGVVDEYAREIDVHALIDVITKREHPNGLQRHEVEQYRCLGPGAGTWDRMVGDFS